MLKQEGSSLLKKFKSNIPSDLRHAIWDVYIGRGYKTRPCPLCGVNQLMRNTNSGFEAAHMVADKFMSGTQELSIYYLFPSCSSCNNECRTQCILDFLFCRLRYKELRSLICAVCTLYREENTELDMKHRLWPYILKTLYGSERFKSGGGLVNENRIYEIAEQEQRKFLANELARLSLREQQLLEEKIFLSENLVMGGGTLR